MNVLAAIFVVLGTAQGMRNANASALTKPAD